MIYSLSIRITEALYKSQVITGEDKEIYAYGFFVLLSKGLFFLISAFFGWMFGVLGESVVFYIMFSVLRCYAGGFHASKESTCTCLTVVALFLSSLSIWHMEKIGNVIIPLCILAACSTVIFVLAPMDSNAKPLTHAELILYKQKSRAIVIVIWVISIIGCCVQLLTVFYAVSASMMLASCLLALGKLYAHITKKAE